MIVTITSRSTRAEIEKALKKLNGQRTRRRHRSKKAFDAYDFCGVLRLKQDPLQLQKKWRNEWE
ncbi:MAG: hypothetical protein HZB42_12180 [Sphingobacteriales bacterium]|nr:hypothetical protein [Sphingobacteriales bacterium]